MSISGLETVQVSGTEFSSTKSNVLGKDDFLQLLVAQLKAQDPLNPMESTAFTAQLAQFSSLEQLYNVNENLGNLQAAQASLTNAESVGFIGKTVTATGNAIQVADGDSSDIHLELSADAKEVFVNIYDGNGNFVRGLEKEAQESALKAGPQSLEWDGKDRSGNIVADGVYTFDVYAKDFQGQAVNATTLTAGIVTGVTFKNGAAYLQAGKLEIPLTKVIEVMEAENETAGYTSTGG